MLVSKIPSRLLILGAALLIAYLVFGSLFNNALAAHLGNRSLQISSATASQMSTYNFKFNLVSNSTMGSISFQFCSNDAIIGDVCTAPSGFSDSTAVLATQSGETGFSISGSSTANDLIIARPVSAVSGGPVNYVFNNITNPSSSGAYFVKIETFTSTNASGSYTDYGAIAFSISSVININATVPPYLLFCTGLDIPNNNCTNATGDFIDFGNLSSSSPASGLSKMLAASNAQNGYDISVYGTTMQSGNNVINALSSPDVSRPGTSQFGLNLRSNSSPSGGSDPGGSGSGTPTPNYNKPNFFTFNSGDIVASTAGPDLDRLYTDDYLVNVPANQAPGVYVSTLTYICLATF